jgi:hypothetical protein
MDLTIASGPLIFLNGDILRVINSTCAQVSLASTGIDTISPQPVVAYRVFEESIFKTTDNGVVIANIGRHEDANFKINNEDARGIATLLLNDITGTDDHNSILVETDTQSYTGVSTFDSMIFSSDGAENVSISGVKIEIDQGSYNKSELSFLDLGSTGGDANTITGIRISGDLAHIIDVGSEDELNVSWCENSSGIFNTTDAFKDLEDNIFIYQEADSICYWGNDNNFTNIPFSLVSFSDKNMNFSAFYCNTSGDWKNMTIDSDNTNGLTNSGRVIFTNPSDRGKCNKQINGSLFSDVGNYTYIALKRNRGDVNVPPKERKIEIGGASTFYQLNTNSTIFDSGIEISSETGFPFIIKDTDSGNVFFVVNPGLNGSATYLRRSFCIFPDYGIQNETQLIDCPNMWDISGIDTVFSYDSSSNRSGLGVLYSIESQKLRLHNDLGEGDLTVEGGASFLLDEENERSVNIISGPLDIRDERIETFGLGIGERFNARFENFETGTLGTFSQETTGGGINEWLTVSSLNCPDVSGSSFCARALGGAERIMVSNLSTSNTNDCNFSFIFTTIKLKAGDILNVTADNNTGSGEVEVYSSDGLNLADELVNVALPSEMNNVSILTLRVISDMAKDDRESYVDNITVSCNSTISTQQNITVSDGRINFGDETCYIFNNGTFDNQSLNLVCTNVCINGNCNITGGGDGETDHSLLSNLEWSNAGHTFVFNSRTVDIGSYNLTTTGRINSSEMVSSGNVTGEEFLGMISCTQIYNGSDTDFCTDADSGAGGASKWTDQGDFLQPNSTFADNVIINGYLNVSDWSNFTGTESQITDLTHTTNCSVDQSCPNVVYGGDANRTTIVSNNITNLPTCSGTDKLTSDGSLFTCDTDENCSIDQSCATVLYTTDEANLNVNSSDFWDNFDTANTTQFENVGGILHIVSSWLIAFLDTWLGGKTTDDLTQGSSNFYDNRSWNETLADSLYILSGDESNLNVNSSDYWDNFGIANTTQFEDDSGELHIVTSWSIDFFNTQFGGKTTDDLTQGSTNLYDNKSWNQTHASSLYISIADEANLNVNSSDNWDNLDTPNSTQFENDAGELHIVTSWSTNFFDSQFSGKTTDDLTQGSTNLYDNKTWNQTLASSLYVDEADTSGWDFDETDDLYINGSRALTDNWDVGAFNVTCNGLKLGDNERTWFGTDDDGSAYFNGTHTIITGPTVQLELG